MPLFPRQPIERKLAMIKVRTDQGEITISSAVFTTITGAAATNCFGVKGMAQRSMTDGLVHLLRPEAMSKGVKVTYNDDGTVSIELHIVVENGVNIATVCRSIMGEVKYVVNLNTGVIHGYFQGMPIPNGGCLIATYVISGAVLPAWLLAIFVVLLGYHLVSKVHNPDFKGASPDVLHKSALAIALIFGVLVLAFVDWHLIITMPFLLYIVFGLVNTAMNVAAAR